MTETETQAPASRGEGDRGVRATLQRRIERVGRHQARLAARSRWFSRVRLAVVLVGGLSALAVGQALSAGGGWLIALATLVVFLVLVPFHERVESARVRARTWRALHARRLARLDLDWDALIADATAPPPDHPFAADLDVAGPRGLLGLLSTAGTRGGHERLAAWLLDPAPDPAAARARQAQVQALVRSGRLRHRLALLGHLAAGSPERRWGDDRLRAWMNAPPPDASLRGWAYVLTALAALTLTLFLVGTPWWGASLLVYLLLYAWRYAQVASVFDRSHDMQRALGEVGPLLTAAERAPALRRSVLADLSGPFRDAPPSQSLRSLRRLSAAAAFTRNDVGRVVLNLLLPYDLLLTLALGRLRARIAGSLEAWLDALYAVEALGALADYAALRPASTTFPDLDGEGLDAADLRHPLLPLGEAVGNDVRIGRGEVLLITGSNMSGKSTFQRAVGLASVLAWAGGAVPAGRLRIGPLRPFASMRVGDVITEGLSTFYAEVRRLRLLLDAVDEHASDAPALILIDEMLRGTNNRERLAGSQAITAHLAGAHALSLVATHDLALTGLAEREPRVRNVHFREQAAGDRLVFDYRLRDGPCPTTNALVIMRNAGLPVPAEAPAHAASTPGNGRSPE